MLENMDRGKVIGMKEAGMSTREVARVTGHGRKTISKIWNEYQPLSSQLGQPGVDKKAVQEKMTEEPRYNSTGRVRHKYICMRMDIRATTSWRIIRKSLW